MKSAAALARGKAIQVKQHYEHCGNVGYRVTLLITWPFQSVEFCRTSETKDGSPYLFFRPHPCLVSKGRQCYLSHVERQTLFQEFL